MPEGTVSRDAMELVELFRRADPDFKGIIFKMVMLAAEHGTPFLQETEKPALAGDRDALKAVLQKREAKSLDEGACA